MARPRMESNPVRLLEQLHKGIPTNQGFFAALNDSFLPISQRIDEVTEKIRWTEPFRQLDNYRLHLSHSDLRLIQELVGFELSFDFIRGLGKGRIDKRMNAASKILLKTLGFTFFDTYLALFALGTSVIGDGLLDTFSTKPDQERNQSNNLHNATSIRHFIINKYRDDIEFLNEGERKTLENLEEIVSRSETLPDIPTLLNVLTGFATLVLLPHHPSLGVSLFCMDALANMYYFNVMKRVKNWRKRYNRHNSELSKDTKESELSTVTPTNSPATANGLLAGKEWINLIPRLFGRAGLTLLIPTIVSLITKDNAPAIVFFLLNALYSLDMFFGNQELTDAGEAMSDIEDLTSALSKLVNHSVSLLPNHQLEKFLVNQRGLPLIKEPGGLDGLVVTYPNFSISLPNFELISPETISFSPGGYLLNGKERSGRSLALKTLTYQVKTEQDYQALVYDDTNKHHPLSDFTPTELRRRFHYIELDTDYERPAFYIFNKDLIFPIVNSQDDPMFKYRELLSRYHKGERLSPDEHILLKIASSLILEENSAEEILAIYKNPTYVTMAQELSESSNITKLKDAIVKKVIKYRKLFNDADVKEVSENKPFSSLTTRLRAKLLLIHSLSYPEKRKVIALDGILDELTETELNEAIAYLKLDTQTNQTAFVFHTNEEHVRTTLLQSGFINSKLICLPSESAGQTTLTQEPI